jgi:hypothetical protein
MFDMAGDMISRLLLETWSVLGELWQLNDNGNDEERALAQCILKRIKPGNVSIQELHFTTDALLNLYYPTDDKRFTGPLGYYGQREWKIVPNFAHNHEWHYEELGEENRRELCE